MDNVCKVFAIQPHHLLDSTTIFIYYVPLFIAVFSQHFLSHSVFLFLFLSPSLPPFLSIYLQVSLCNFVSLSLSLSISIFCRFSTEKVPKIDRLLGKYKGREEEFLRFVYQKYGNKIIFLFLITFIAACLFANFCYTIMPFKFTPALSLIYFCLSYHHLFLFSFFYFLTFLPSLFPSLFSSFP